MAIPWFRGLTDKYEYEYDLCRATFRDLGWVRVLGCSLFCSCAAFSTRHNLRPILELQIGTTHSGVAPQGAPNFQISCRSDASADAAAAAKMLAKRFELQKVSSSLETKAGITAVIQISMSKKTPQQHNSNSNSNSKRLPQPQPQSTPYHLLCLRLTTIDNWQ